MVMEARLSQHICFKTVKEKRQSRETSPECTSTRQRNPVFKIEDAEHLMDFATENSPIGTVATPPFLKSEMPGKSFLFLPKLDHRNRLTSTPNQEQVTSNIRSGIDEAFDFSPTGCWSPDGAGKRLSCLEQNESMEDIRSVLFPPHLVPKESVSFQDSAVSSIEDNVKRKRPQSSKRKPDTHLKAISPNNISMSSLSPSKKQHQNMTQSFQDSGIESFVGVSDDTSCQQQETSHFSSPLKRRAESNGSMVSLESPMKRLAFMSLENQQQDVINTSTSFNQRLEKIDASQPGSFFLLDRTSSVPCKDVDISLPPPIFANTIQFISPPKTSVPRNSTSIVNKTSSEDFKFTKPSVLPLKARKQPSQRRIPLFKTANVDPVCGSHIGERHFDIISGLAERNLHHLVSRIFSGIRQKDVLRCSRVSRSWSNTCRVSKFVRGTIKSLKKQYRDEEFTRGSENFNAKKAVENALLKSPAKVGSTRNLSAGRAVLGNLQARARRTPTKPILMPKTPSGKNSFVPADSKFEHHQGVKRSLDFGETTRLCPNCGWTAKVYNGDDHKGQCYRLECRYTFCTSCNRDYHSTRPCKVKESTSPKDIEKTVKAGSKKSKARLKKRLLL